MTQHTTGEDIVKAIWTHSDLKTEPSQYRFENSARIFSRFAQNAKAKGAD